ALDDDRRRDVALAKAGHLHPRAELASGVGHPPFQLLDPHLGVDPHARVAELGHRRLHRSHQTPDDSVRAWSSTVFPPIAASRRGRGPGARDLSTARSPTSSPHGPSTGGRAGAPTSDTVSPPATGGPPRAATWPPSAPLGPLLGADQHSALMWNGFGATSVGEP